MGVISSIFFCKWEYLAGLDFSVLHAMTVLLEYFDFVWNI